MRKTLLSLFLCALLAVPALGMALPQDYALHYGGDLLPVAVYPALSPRSLLTLAAYAPETEPQKDDPGAIDPALAAAVPFPDPADVRPVGQALLPTMIFGEAYGVDKTQRAAGLAPGFTTLWGGEVKVLKGKEKNGPSLVTSGMETSPALTGEFVPRTADAGEPPWGTITPAALNTGIQSLVSASEMPAADHFIILAGQSTLTAAVESDLPAVLLETRGLPANLLLDEGSKLELTGPISLADGPLATLSLAPSAQLRMDYRPSAALPHALILPAVWTLSEEALVDIRMRKPIPAAEGAPAYTPAVFALSSLGANQLSLAPGTSLTVKQDDRNGRLFAVGQGLAAGTNQGVLEISANKVTLTGADNRKTTWDNGSTPFILTIRYDGTGRVLAAETAGYIGKAPASLAGKSLADLTALSASRPPEATKLPEKEKEEDEEDDFNGWAIGVDHVYEEGGRRVLIPQPGSHTVSWASKTGDDVTIKPGSFPGFTPVEPEHVVRNVKKHQSYEYLYTRNTTMRTATIQVNPTGLDATQLDALRTAARGNIQLYQGGTYQEFAYVVPSNADSTTVSGTVYTHTPTGSPLPANFSMAAVPAGLALTVSGDVFTLAFATPPTPPVTPPPPTPQVTVNVVHRYTQDGGGTYAPLPNTPTSATVDQGKDLSNDASFAITRAGFTYQSMTGPTAAQAGDTVTVSYKRNSLPITATLTVTGPSALPQPVINNAATCFAFLLDIGGAPTPPSGGPTVSGNTVTADWGTQFTHDPDGNALLGAMSCTVSLPDPAPVALTDSGGTGAYANTTEVKPTAYTVTVGYTADGSSLPFTTSVTGYYQETVSVSAPTYAGLTLNDTSPKDVGPLDTDTSVSFAYTRNTATPSVTIYYAGATGADDTLYAQVVTVHVPNMEGNGEDPILVSMDKRFVQGWPDATVSGDASFYTHSLPTAADGTGISAYVPSLITLTDGGGLISLPGGSITATGYTDITIVRPDPAAP